MSTSSKQKLRAIKPRPFITLAERHNLPLADPGPGKSPRLNVNETLRKLREQLDNLVGKR